MGAVVTALAIRHPERTRWGEYTVGIAVFLSTALLLILGEITPKALRVLEADARHVIRVQVDRPTGEQQNGDD